MPYDAKVVKVMIASPGDVETERQIVRSVLNEWNYVHSEDRKLVLMPIGWETHASPAMGDRPQGIINEQILKDCDLLVAIFWTRLGTPTGAAASGTVEEIEEHIKAGKPAMLYFSSAPVRLESVDNEQYAALKEFKQECFKKGLVEPFDSVGEFRETFGRQLGQTVIRHFLGSAQPDAATVAPASDLPAIGSEAKSLLLAAVASPRGYFMRVQTRGGLHVSANETEFLVNGTGKDAATWESAVSDLEHARLVVDRGGKHEVFFVTRTGYEIAELIRST